MISILHCQLQLNFTRKDSYLQQKFLNSKTLIKKSFDHYVKKKKLLPGYTYMVKQSNVIQDLQFEIRMELLLKNGNISPPMSWNAYLVAVNSLNSKTSSPINHTYYVYKYIRISKTSIAFFSTVVYTPQDLLMPFTLWHSQMNVPQHTDMFGYHINKKKKRKKNNHDR